MAKKFARNSDDKTRRTKNTGKFFALAFEKFFNYKCCRELFNVRIECR